MNPMMAVAYGAPARKRRQTPTNLRGITEDVSSRLYEADDQAYETRGGFTTAINNYDPNTYIQAATQGLQAQIAQQAGQAYTGQRQAMNRRGFYGSNMGTGAINRAMADATVRGAGDIAYRGAGMEAQRIGMMGDLYRSDQGRADEYLAARSDLIMSEADRKAAEEAEKRRGRGSLIGSALGLAGTVLGGPIGGAIGKWAGKKWGN